MHIRTRLLLVLALAAGALVPVAGVAAAGGDRHPPGSVAPDAVLAWNATATRAAISCGLSDAPPIEARLYAMMHIAMHDAVNAIRRDYQPYEYRPRTLRPDASPHAALAAAAWTVLNDALGECPALGEAGAAYDAAVAAVADPAARAAGIAVGQAAAAAIQDERKRDRAAKQIANPVDPGFKQGKKPGEWKFTPTIDGVTINAVAFLPHWGQVRPFTLRYSKQFAPSGPYRLDSAAYAQDLNEIKALGGGGAGDTAPTLRTPEQTDIALFWVGSSPYQWNAIARTVTAANSDIDLWNSARLFGLVNMALADGYISSFKVKYDELFWRPVTAIREADTDGNRLTQADPTWAPLRETPPIPDYDSAHAVEGAAASAVLRAFFGDDTSFANCSPWYPAYPDARNNCADGTAGPGMIRGFTSFSQAATENGLSRIYVGYHFRKAVDDGLQHGRQIGDWAVSTTMQPVHG